MITPRLRRSLALVSLASLAWAFTFGLGASLASLFLRDAGCSAGTIGLNTSLYYLGIAVTAPFVPRFMTRYNRTCVAAGMLLDALAVALFPLVTGEAAWHLLRLVGGSGTALSLIPMETVVNHDAPHDSRARVFGLYAFCVALGIGMGSVAGLPLYPVAPVLTFLIGGLATLLATPLAWIAVPPRMEQVEEGVIPLPVAPPVGFLSLGTAWAQGFLEGGTLAFLSLYLLHLGHPEATVSGLLAGLFVGVLVAQLPVTWLADRLGRRRVLLACHAVLLAGLLSLPWLRGTPALAGWLFVLGAGCGALYPLGLAFLGQHLPSTALARANAWFLTSNCAGSLSGPLVMGLAIDTFGLHAQFSVAAAAVAVVLLGWLVLNRRPLASQRGTFSSLTAFRPRRAA